MKKYFNEQMTSDEARTVLFRIVEGKTRSEIEAIKAEYLEISSKIFKRELELAENGWLIG